MFICCELYLTKAFLSPLHRSHIDNPYILSMYSMHNNLTSTNINCETFIITSNHLHNSLSYTVLRLPSPRCCFIPTLFWFLDPD